MRQQEAGQCKSCQLPGARTNRRAAHPPTSYFSSLLGNKPYRSFKALLVAVNRDPRDPSTRVGSHSAAGSLPIGLQDVLGTCCAEAKRLSGSLVLGSVS